MAQEQKPEGMCSWDAPAPGQATASHDDSALRAAFKAKDDIECADDQTCVNGKCKRHDPCAGVVCEPGLACHRGRCVDPLCWRVKCPGREVCEDGACMDPCANITCGKKQRCVNGECRPRH